jgi:outer membrane protein insertion porin family
MLEGSWWVPVGSLGGGETGQGAALFALGLSIKGGAIFGNASSFPFDRFWMGGVQFGQLLRGYDETSITPFGYFPDQSASVADAQRLGDSFISISAEYAMRLSDMLSASTFFDAGNLCRSPGDIDPTRLYRGAGVGIQIVTPFGPIGVDYAYGFDKTVPGWQLHFRMGPGF